MKNNPIRHLIVALLALALVLCPAALAESYTAGAMRLLHYEGAVEILDAAGAPRFIMENARFDSGETLVTGEDGVAAVGLDADRIVSLDSNSRVIFEKQGGAMKLTLTEGALLLDVQKKLDPNETLDIQTSTMTVGIRGTIVYLKAEPSATGDGVRSTLGVLEGTAQVTYLNPNGVRQTVPVSAGEIATLTGVSAAEPVTDVLVKPLTPQDVPGFVTELPDALPDTNRRIEEGIAQLGEEGDSPDFPASGNWTWNEPITLVAQSASKLYDGKPLTRPSDVLVYGLPAQCTIHVTAHGEITHPGFNINSVGDYAIYNAAGMDVTSHFTNIQKVNGRLVVDPAPLTVWTGSAEKVYDGTPLTNPEAGISAQPGYEKNTTPWRNLSYVQTTATNAQVLLGMCGVTWVHGTNPLTEETKEIALQAGEKLTVVLNDADDARSIEFKIEKLSVEEIPEEALRLYARNPEVLKQACQDAGWDPEALAERIAQLAEQDDALVSRHGLDVSDEEAGRLMVDCTDVRITVDTKITNYNDRALGSEEAHYTPVNIPEDIVVTATGSQTEVGESPNTYEITWGDSDPSWYILSEELGTLTVTAAPVVEDAVALTADSASKVYDGTPLTADGFTATGLPEGFTATAVIEGSQTDAGSCENTIASYNLFDADGADVTGQFTNITIESGTLTVEPAEATVATGSASKVYDGKPLTCDEASITGLIDGETAAVTATGEITDVGTAENTYTIDWGETNPDNYAVSEDLGTLKVTEHDEEVTFALSVTSLSKTYDGTPLSIDIAVEPARNAADAPEADAARQADADITVTGLPEGFSFTAKVSASQLNVGSCTYTITDLAILDENGQNVTAFFSNVKTIEGTLTVEPAGVTVTTGSASKVYDGTPLTCGEASITGLVEGETATVTATGEITDVGTAENTYIIDWGETNKDNYAVSEELGTLTVAASDTEITLTAASAGKTYDGKPLTDDGFTVEGLPEGFTATAVTEGSQTDAGSTANTIGEYAILDADGQDVTAFFTNVVTVEGTLTVSPTEVTVTTESASKAYDGTPLTGGEASITGLVGEETAVVTATGTITDVGTAENTCAIDWGETDPDNYAVSEELGTLKVTANDAEIILTAASASKTYDGKPLINGGFTAAGLPEGFTATATTEGSQRDADSSVNAISDYAILDGEGKDVTAFFANVKTVDGTLTVSPAQVTVTTGSASKAYDGTPLTAGEATITGLVEGETATVTATGSITDAGSADNTYAIDWGDTNPDNYTVSESLGTLEVTPLAVSFNLGGYTREYSGDVWLPEGPSSEDATRTDLQVLTDDGERDIGVAATFSLPGGEVVLTVYGFEDVGSHTLSAEVSFSSGKAENYEFSYTKTAMTITPMEITVRLHDGSDLVYNGETQLGNFSASGAGYDIGYILDGERRITWDERIIVNVTGGGKDVGDYTLSCTFAPDGDANMDNYHFTVTGTAMTIVPAPATVTTGSTERNYNFAALTNAEAAITGLKGGDTATVTATGTITDVGTAQNTYTIDWGDTDPNNYTLTEALGTLKVNKLPITLSLGGGTFVYDGQEHGADLSVTCDITPLHVQPYGTGDGPWHTWRLLFQYMDFCFVGIKGGGTDVGSYTLEYNTSSGTFDLNNLDITVTDTVVEIEKLQLKFIPMGSSSDYEYVYDGNLIEWWGPHIHYLNGQNKGGYISQRLLTTTAMDIDLYTGDHFTGMLEFSGEAGWRDAGTYPLKMVVTIGGETENKNISVSIPDQTVTVKPAELSIVTKSDSKPYDGTPLTAPDVTVTGLTEADESEVTVTATGTITDAGTVNNTYDIVWGSVNSGNYTLTDELGKLKVSKRHIIVTPYYGMDDLTVPYKHAWYPINCSWTQKDDDGNYVDGGYSIDYNESTVDEFKATFTWNWDDVCVVTVTGGGWQMGEYPSSGSMSVSVGNPSNYVFECTNKTLKIVPAPLTVTTGSASKAYDGTPLTNSEASLSGLVEGETATVVATGSQTDVGESSNTYTINWPSDQIKNHYTIVENLGTLKVTPRNVTITSPTREKAYDGKPLTPDIVVDGLPGDYNCHIAGGTLLGSQTDVGETDIGIDLNGIGIINADDIPVDKKNFNIVTNLGKLKVTPATLIVTTNAKRKYYDGTPLTSTASLTGLVNGETATVVATGSRTDVGESDNPYEITWGTAKQGNYKITWINGKLTIDPATLTVKTGSNSKLYDGLPLTNSEASLTGLVNGETATVEATGSQTIVGESSNTYKITWGTAKQGNYTISEDLGTLSVVQSTTDYSMSLPPAKTFGKPKATNEPTVEPTDEPTAAPTEAPEPEPTAAPTEAPTDEPTAAPTEAPTDEPTAAPTQAPADEPTAAPTEAPEPEPTAAPTKAPEPEPTDAPTEAPTSDTPQGPKDAPSEKTETPSADVPANEPADEPKADPGEAASDKPANVTEDKPAKVAAEPSSSKETPTEPAEAPADSPSETDSGEGD